MSTTEKPDDFRQKQPLYPDMDSQNQPYPHSTSPTIVVEQPGGYVREERRRTFVLQIITSCIVTWCYCLVMGVIAFILAMVANNKSANGKGEEAKKMGRASCYVSLVGVVMGLFVGVFVLGGYIGLILVREGYFKSFTQPEATTPPPAP